MRRASTALAAAAILVLVLTTTDAFTSPLHRRTSSSLFRSRSTSTTSLNVQQQQQQQFFDANGNPVAMPMVYDANGNPVPFHQPQQPPVAAAQVNPAQPIAFEPNLPNTLEPPLPTRSRGADEPRPAGYNADAYAVSNTADVYFAQLKQDSKVRKIARLSGDLERANQVFADDSVREIGESWNENPYTKEQNYEEARAQIEGTVRMQVMGGNDAPVITSGISYKEKLEQRKKKAAQQQQQVADVVVVEQQPLQIPPAAAAAADVVVSTPPPPEAETPQILPAAVPVPPRVEMPPPKAVAAADVSTSPKAVAKEVVPAPAATAAVTTPSSGPVDDEEEVRRSVRTLQGLLLKHRGGPGFGAGRLKAPEATRLEDTLEDVVGMLRAEVGMEAAAVEIESKPVVKTMASASLRSLVEPKNPVVMEQQPKPVVAAKPIAPLPPPVAVSNPVVDQPVVVASTPLPPVVQTQSPTPDTDPLADPVAQVEAALKMYKESSNPEEMVMKLREALMAAASASNRAIIDTETKKEAAAMEKPVAAAAAPAAPSMGFPTEYAVTKPTEEDSMERSEVADTPAAAAPPAESAPAQPIAHDPNAQAKLGVAIAKMDATAVSAALASGASMTEEQTDSAFWTVIRAVDRAEADDKALPADVPKMLHHIFDADMQHLAGREKETLNVTCMMPEVLGANRIAMNSIFDDAAHKDIPLTEGRRCEEGTCCDKCSRNVFRTFASESETSFEQFPGIEQLTFNELTEVPAATILQFIRLIERVRRTIAHEYGLPLSSILPLQAYSRKYVAGTTQQGGGGGEGDFVILHTDEATHTGYHYSCVIYLSNQGEDFQGGNFVFNDPRPESAEKQDLSHLGLEEQIRQSGRELKPFHPSKGAAVIFSSGWENMHEVEKITSGTRYAVPCFFTTCPVPTEAYQPPTMAVGKPKTDEDNADDWLHLLLAHREEKPHESLGRVKELLMKWHTLCTPLSEH